MVQLGLSEQLVRYEFYFAAGLLLIPMLAFVRLAVSSLRDLGADRDRWESRVVLRADPQRNTITVIEFARDGLTSHVHAGSSAGAVDKHALRDAA
jgi:hypothetical protein